MIEWKLTCNGVGRVRRQLHEPWGDGRQFGYDGLGRLLADSLLASVDPEPCTTTGPDPNDEGAECNEQQFALDWEAYWVDSFAYDSAGNPTDRGGSYGLGNRIQAFDNCTSGTDNDGNVTQRSCAGETITIAWNGDNRPNRFTVNGKTIDLYYDPSGRLVRRDTSGVAQAYFLWDGDNLFAELDGTGEKRAEYSYYPGQDNLHAVIKGSTPYYAHTDGLGNVVAVTNPSQQLAWTYEYDAWGQPTDGGGADTLNNRARFKGALWLGPEAEFYYMRNRWYEPKTGRFLSEDPIGLEGGLNLYAFAGNDPVNGRDPMGLDGCTLWAWVEKNPRGEIERIIGDPWWGDSDNPYKPCAEDEAGRPGGQQPQSKCGPILSTPGAREIALALRERLRSDPQKREWGANLYRSPGGNIWGVVVLDYLSQTPDSVRWGVPVDAPRFFGTAHTHDTNNRSALWGDWLNQLRSGVGFPTVVVAPDSLFLLSPYSMSFANAITEACGH